MINKQRCYQIRICVCVCVCVCGMEEQRLRLVSLEWTLQLDIMPPATCVCVCAYTQLPCFARLINANWRRPVYTIKSLRMRRTQYRDKYFYRVCRVRSTFLPPSWISQEQPPEPERMKGVAVFLLFASLLVASSVNGKLLREFSAGVQPRRLSRDGLAETLSRGVLLNRVCWDRGIHS